MKKFLVLTLVLSMSVSMVVSAAPSRKSRNEEPTIRQAVYVEPPAPPIPEAEQKAAAAGKTIVEYVSNTVIETPGLPNAAPIAQGGGCVINGAASNATFTLNAVDNEVSAYAISKANSVGGTLLNVVDISAPGINFTNAEVGFSVTGVKEGDNIAVYQAVNGDWVPVEVAEVSDNSVKIKMNNAGIFCFIKL